MSFESSASDNRSLEKRQDARDLQLRLYRELGLLAVAVELGLSSARHEEPQPAARADAWSLRPVEKKILAA